MSWLVKLGKAPRSPHSSRQRQFNSPKPSLSSLLQQHSSNQNRPLNFNCNNFRVRHQLQQDPPHQYNQFAQVLKLQRDKKTKSTKTKKNIIFTENNCFAKAVKEYKEHQKMKSTVKFEVPLVIQEADVEESIDVQETMKRKGKRVGWFEIEEAEEQEMREMDQRKQSSEIDQRTIVIQNKVEIVNNPQPVLEIRNQIEIVSQPQQPQSPRSLTPSRRVTVLKCRVVHTPTRIAYANDNIISPKQKPLIDQTNMIYNLSREPVTVALIKPQSKRQSYQQIVIPNITNKEYKIQINGVDMI